MKHTRFLLIHVPNLTCVHSRKGNPILNKNSFNSKSVKSMIFAIKIFKLEVLRNGISGQVSVLQSCHVFFNLWVSTEPPKHPLPTPRVVNLSMATACLPNKARCETAISSCYLSQGVMGPSRRGHGSPRRDEVQAHMDSSTELRL